MASSPWVFHVFFSFFTLVLVSIRCMGGLGGKVGSGCEGFEDNKGDTWSHVSESSGAGSPGLSQINGCCCYCSDCGICGCSLPCFSLPCAVDVLTTGTYSRLPSCIRVCTILMS